jgi:hypothetical protein
LRLKGLQNHANVPFARSQVISPQNYIANMF